MPEPTGRKEYVYWADLTRVAAMFLVVMIHVSGQLTNAWGQIPDAQWIIADIYGGLARISVPLFFMISGYLLLPRSESLRDFCTKRMTRVLVPFIVWSLIYLAWFCGGHPGTCTPNLVANLLLVQGTYYHLWFLYVLTSVYLVLPVLRLMVRPEVDKVILWYLIGLWLVFQPLLTIANKLWNFQINISAPLATGFACYFVLGYLLGEVALSRPGIIVSMITWISGTLATIIGTYLMTRASGRFDGFFYDFLSLNVILASGAAFLLLRWAAEGGAFNSPRIHSVTRSLASGTFGIYLIHIIVIEVLGFGIPFLHVNAFMGSASWSIPLVSTLVFLISFFVVKGLQRIPIIKQIVP
jgi:surface polysaccharide O-acyltransferase-like enzyme